MGRQIFLSLCASLCALLAAGGASGCAGGPPRKPATEPVVQDVYLQGITTEDSKRIDQLNGGDPAQHPRVSALMPGALTAEYQGLYITASLFRHGDYLTLDLVARNLGDSPVELDRGRIELIDNDGHVLQPVADWSGAAEHGLRAAHRGKDTQLATDDLALEEALEGSPSGGISVDEPVSKLGVTERGEDVGEVTIPDDTPHPAREGRELTEATDVAENANAPRVLDVEPKQSRAFWAYWTTEGHGVDSPLTAVVKLRDRQMVFRFGV